MVKSGYSKGGQHESQTIFPRKNYWNESFEYLLLPLILRKVSNFSKMFGEISEIFNRKSGFHAIFDSPIASMEAYFEVPNPDFGLRAHLSTLYGDYFEDFQPPHDIERRLSAPGVKIIFQNLSKSSSVGPIMEVA
jgi:hypothetical protein